ncbi:hypothetical protein NQ317_010550 [Molorchus minor]|uniref:Uncharacterized protein n=1 Tax=Molorchus minor TaxID=1323400 RepID=A0ABQ9JE77_9CUCU|nr:hypothetical protein NQ317_010550 [Molorchus minor]
MPCRPSTSECGKGSEPHLIQSSTSLTSTASKAEEQILNWLKSLHHRKQRILWGLILDLKEFFYVSIQKKNKQRGEITREDSRQIFFEVLDSFSLTSTMPAYQKPLPNVRYVGTEIFNTYYNITTFHSYSELGTEWNWNQLNMGGPTPQTDSVCVAHSNFK